MAIKTIAVTIKGKTPLLMHKYPMVPPPIPIEKMTPGDAAEFVSYRRKDGELYIPGINIQRALIGGATYSKGKGRASLQKPASACLMVTPEHIGLGTKDYEIDSRPVVVPATKGRVVRHRPRLDAWECAFELEYDQNLLTEAQVRQIVDDTGERVGLLDFRPEKKGPFGRFMVTAWKVKG